MREHCRAVRLRNALLFKRAKNPKQLLHTREPNEVDVAARLVGKREDVVLHAWRSADVAHDNHGHAHGRHDSFENRGKKLRQRQVRLVESLFACAAREAEEAHFQLNRPHHAALTA